jgi:transcriptional regulator with XRE-family HTH domain
MPVSRFATHAARVRFAAWFKGVRAKKGLSQGEAADALDADAATITRWESAATLPSSPVLLRLQRWSGISAVELLMLVSEDIP